MPLISQEQVTAIDTGGNDLSLCSIACADELIDSLRQSIVGNPSPILLVGEEGSGKYYIAKRLAAALLCHAPDDKDGACGSCPSCRSLAQGEHFDLIELAPPDDKKTIAVASVREQVAATLHIFPQLSQRRVYIISAVKGDTLNEQGQNALLKPLEEHPEFVRFILLTEDVERLLPTIRSRSRVIYLRRRSDHEIRTILKQNGEIDQASVELAVLYADGLPGKALAIVGDKEFRELRTDVFDFFLQLFNASRTFALTEWQKLLQEGDGKAAGTKLQKHERMRVGDVLRLLESFSRDLLILKEAIPHGKLVNLDFEESLKAVLRKYPATDPLRAALLIQQTSRALSANVLFDHAIARLMLGLRHYLSGQSAADHVYLPELSGL
ncbi:MAG TPA: hypothetical protein GX734_07330 [Clostridiaceae bacterium]|jgi:DNA polymerase-3 subunit delta'|nr:hypothetical protein [Clostridiaceae bacterium]